MKKNIHRWNKITENQFFRKLTEIEPDGSEGVPRIYYLHELESSVIINKVVEELKISSRAMDKRVLLNLIADMLEKKKSGDYRVIDEVELLALQEGLANHKLASVQHVKLQRPDIAIEITVPDIGTKVLLFDPKYKLQSEMSPNIV